MVKHTFFYMEEFIKSLLRKNFTSATILNRCQKQGWTVTPDEIEILRNEVTLEIEAEKIAKKQKTSKEKSVIKLFSELETYEEFRERIGIDTEFKDAIQLITLVQGLSANIFIRQALCLMKGLELQCEGNAIDIEILFKSYDIAFKVLCKAWGIDNLVNVNAAFQCLESKGYLSDSALPQVSEILKN